MSPEHLAEMVAWARKEQTFLEECAARVAAMPPKAPEPLVSVEADDWFDERREEALRAQLEEENRVAVAAEESLWDDGPRAYCRRNGL